MNTVYEIEIVCKNITPNKIFPDVFATQELAEKVVDELKRNTLGYFPSDFIKVCKPKFNIRKVNVVESVDDFLQMI